MNFARKIRAKSDFIEHKFKKPKLRHSGKRIFLLSVTYFVSYCYGLEDSVLIFVLLCLRINVYAAYCYFAVMNLSPVKYTCSKLYLSLLFLLQFCHLNFRNVRNRLFGVCFFKCCTPTVSCQNTLIKNPS